MFYGMLVRGSRRFGREEVRNRTKLDSRSKWVDGTTHSGLGMVFVEDRAPISVHTITKLPWRLIYRTQKYNLEIY